MYVYSSLGAPEDVNVDAWAAYLRAVRDSLNAQWARTKSAYLTLKGIRAEFNLPFIADPVATEGGTVSDPGAWNTQLENYIVKLQSIVEVLNKVATDALEDKRQVGWNSQTKDFEIEKLPGDTVSVKLVNGLPELVADNGSVIQPTGTVGLAPIAWVGIVAVVAVAVYYTTESVCGTVEKTAEQKTMQTLGDQAAKLVAQGKATPAEAAALTSSVYKGQAEVSRAQAEAAAQKPTNQLADVAKTLGFVGLGIAVIWLAVTVIGRTPSRALATARAA